MAPRDLWTQADLDLLVHKREVEKKTFSDIAQDMGRPEGSCWRRYVQIAKAREPAPSIVPAQRPRRIPFHREMGIETYVHHQAVLHSPFDGRRSAGWMKVQPVYAHWYRVPVTLAKVW